jgi:cytochrome c oxidase cbb3-type subunit 1
VNAGRHALAWLTIGNVVGLWLSLLLLFPSLQTGAWTYGRWVPVHLNLQLFGWTALPLAGWLLETYEVARRWQESVLWAWSAALAVGALSWLEGNTTGKIFLDWKGGPLLSYLAVLAFLWLLLACARRARMRTWSRPKRALTFAGLCLLALVPFALCHAASPAVYPPVDPTTGGPTGASLLGSTLVVVALLMLLPRAFGLIRRNHRPLRMPLLFFAISWLVFFFAEHRGGSHRDPLQIFAMALLLPWGGWVVCDWRRFRWEPSSKSWRAAVFLWWALLTLSGFIEFLPGVLDRLKFTHALVAHSHLAMAGFTTSFCGLLLNLLGNRFGSTRSFFAWHGAAALMVVTLAAIGWGESVGPHWMTQAPPWRTAGLGLRSLCGLVMLIASGHWLFTFQSSQTHRS